MLHPSRAVPVQRNSNLEGGSTARPSPGCHGPSRRDFFTSSDSYGSKFTIKYTAPKMKNASHKSAIHHGAGWLS